MWVFVFFGMLGLLMVGIGFWMAFSSLGDIFQRLGGLMTIIGLGTFLLALLLLGVPNFFK